MLNHSVKDAQPTITLRSLNIMGEPETMGDRIKSYRLGMGLTQQQLADFVGATKSAVSQWESGDVVNIRPTHFTLLCLLFAVDPEFLLWGPSREPTGGFPPLPDTVRARLKRRHPRQ